MCVCVCVCVCVYHMYPYELCNVRLETGKAKFKGNNCAETSF